jgi:hypothetical protein
MFKSRLVRCVYVLANSLMRYAFALVWVGLLLLFSYCDIILNLIMENGIPLENIILKSHAPTFMILTNVGLIFLFCFVWVITYHLTKQEYKKPLLDMILLISIIFAISLTVIAQEINDGAKFVNWLKLSYLFGIFIISVIAYKAETLNRKHISTDSDILPSINN